MTETSAPTEKTPSTETTGTGPGWDTYSGVGNGPGWGNHPIYPPPTGTESTTAFPTADSDSTPNQPTAPYTSQESYAAQNYPATDYPAPDYSRPTQTPTDGPVYGAPADRSIITAGLLALQFYLAWSNVPEDIGIHSASLIITVVLTVFALVVAYRKPRYLAGALAVGIVVVLSAQTNFWFTGNYNVTPWKFPRQVAFLESKFEDRYQGTTFAIADPVNIPPDNETGQWGDRSPSGAIRNQRRRSR